MRALDRAVLVRDAGVVARGLHAVMAHQVLIALRQILLRVAVEVAERRRQAVAAMLLRHAAERPQRVLQALRERDEALAAEDHVGMLEAGEREAEVVEPVIERLPGERDAQLARVGEVGQCHAAGLVLLAEDHVLLGTMQRAPRIDATLQRAADVRVQPGMPTAQLVEHADHPDAGSYLQDRDDLGVPVGLQRIGSAPLAWRLPLRRQSRIVLDPISGRGGEPRLGRSGLGRECLSGTHVQPHLVVVDVEAGQVVILLVAETNQQLGTNHPTARRASKNAPPVGTVLRSGYALPSSRPHRRILTLIVAEFSP